MRYKHSLKINDLTNYPFPGRRIGRAPRRSAHFVNKCGNVASGLLKRRATLEAALTALGPDQYDRLLAAGRSVLRQRPSLAGHVLRIDMVALAPGRFPRHRRGVAASGRGAA